MNAKLPNLPLSEYRRLTGKAGGYFISNSNNVAYYAGHETECINGIAIVTHNEYFNCVITCEAVSDHEIAMQIKATAVYLIIIQVYALSNETYYETVDYFYVALEETKSKL